MSNLKHIKSIIERGRYKKDFQSFIYLMCRVFLYTERYNNTRWSQADPSLEAASRLFNILYDLDKVIMTL